MIQSFLAVAETGSLSAAATHLGRSQPTIGRHIQTLEQLYDTPLFERHARGLKLADQGVRLLPMAQEMNRAMTALALEAAGQSSRLNGTVRITASVYASHFILPPILARIRASEPLIDIVLIPTDRTENLLFRAADIAVRMYRPTQLDTITRKIGELGMGVFAAKSYLARAGRPDRLTDLFNYDVVGFDQNDLILRTMRDMGFDARAEAFAGRCDNQAAYWELVRAGCGIGFSQTIVGRADPLVEELIFDIEIPPLEVWLATHQAMHQTPRIRRVWSLLADELSAITRAHNAFA
ncbi:MAG: LysR family transcriptional regulator [Arenibacterium sp.]